MVLYFKAQEACAGTCHFAYPDFYRAFLTKLNRVVCVVDQYLSQAQTPTGMYSNAAASLGKFSLINSSL